MNPDFSTITAYIYAQRQNGYSDVAIYESLVSSGWPGPTVQQALSMLARVQPQQTVYTANQLPQPLPQAPPRAGMFSRRLNRVGILMSFVYVIGFLLIPTVLLFITRNNPTLNMICVVIGVVGSVFTIPIAISTGVRRCHDLNQSGYLALLGFIPFVGVVMTLVYLLVPGTNGPNKYGDPDSSPSTLGKVLIGK